MPTSNTVRIVALALIACGLAGCGSDGELSTTEQTPAPEVPRTCDSIRSEVIRTAATNGVTIVKIYDPQTVLNQPAKISCKGRALVSSGQQAIIYYRDFKDQDGDWLIQYAEQPLD